MWCQDLSKVPAYDRNEVIKIINSDIYLKKDLSESLIIDADKKTIEILKEKLSDFVSKLEEAYCKYFESEYRTQRAEYQSEDYLELIKKKIVENKKIYESIEPLNSQISSLSEAFGNSKKEIERLILLNKNLSEEIKYKNEELDDLKIKNEKFKKKNFELLAEKEKLTQKYEVKNELLEMMQLSLDRYQSKTKDKSKEKNSVDNYGKLTKDKDGNLSSGLGIRGKDQAEETLRMRLQIVDLKKRLGEEEKIRLNLFEVIKSKKAKNKNLKAEIDKIVSVFDQTVKDNKWSQDLIMQKDTIIKVLREKLAVLNNEIKVLNKKLVKLKLKPLNEEKGVSADLPLNPDFLVNVKANPNIFVNKNFKKI